MSSRIRIFLTGLLTLLIAALLAFAPVGAKPASGGYQLFGGAVSGHQAVISLAALENFDYHAKIAPECCNATNGGELTTSWDKWTPPSGYARNADGTVVHTGSGQVYTPLRDSAGNVRTNSAGDPIFNTQSGGTTAQTTLTKPAASGQVIELPNAPKGGVSTLPKAPPPPTGKFNIIYPRGPGAADGPLPEGYTYVSRWVSPQEAKMWLDNQGTAIPSAAGHVPGATTPRVFVTQQFDGTPPGATGRIRIDFAAPEAMMHTGTGSSTGLDRVIFQPATSTPIHNVRIHVPDGITIPK